jgi:hypothetical protein
MSSPSPTSKCSTTFQPQLESLGERIVPSVTGDPLQTMSNRAITLLGDIGKTDAAALQKDVAALQNDLNQSIAEIQSAEQNLITWFNAQPQDYKQVAAPLVTSIITSLIKDQVQLQESATLFGGAASAIGLNADNPEFPSDFLRRAVQEGLPEVIFDFYHAEVDAAAKVQLINDVALPTTNPDTSSVQATQATLC